MAREIDLGIEEARKLAAEPIAEFAGDGGESDEVKGGTINTEQKGVSDVI